MKRTLQAIAVAGVATIGGFGQARADVVLSGPVANAGAYSTSSLAVLAGGATATSDGLTGIPLWNLLGGANSSSPTSPIYGGITTSTPSGDNGKNAILRYYLVGTSAGGRQSVVSLGEIDPNFGGTAATPVFVAFENTGGPLATPELIVPGAPGRDLTNLTSLQLRSVAALPTGAGGMSSAVQLSGNVNNPGSYTLSSLQSSFTPVTETVSGDNYTGVPLWTFLNANDNSITSQIVTTQATDGYEVLLSLAELDPALGGNPADFLPYADTGTDFPSAAVARTLFPTDNKHGRWESNLNAVIVSEVPEPASLTVIAVAFISLGIARRHRA